MTVLVSVRPTETSGSQCLSLSCALVIQSQPNTAAGECSVTKLRLRSAVRTILLLSNDCLSSFHIPNIRPLSPSTSPDFLSEKKYPAAKYSPQSPTPLYNQCSPIAAVVRQDLRYRSRRSLSYGRGCYHHDSALVWSGDGTGNVARRRWPVNQNKIHHPVSRRKCLVQRVCEFQSKATITPPGDS